MNLEEKIAHAQGVIQSTLRGWKNPAVMCSFGKDSMVVLHLVRQVADLPVIFHREPFQHHKYAFASRVIKEWDLSIYDYLPVRTEVQEQDGEFEIVKHYQVGARTCSVPVGIREPAGRLICGLNDIYLCPKGSIAYPWDVVFHGHKSTDSDPIMGDVPLGADSVRALDYASVSFPIRHFTDADVWEYTERFGLPVHGERYEKTAGGWRERADKTDNPDYINACVACMSGGAFVECPKLGHRVASVRNQLKWAEAAELHYLSKPA